MAPTAVVPPVEAPPAPPERPGFFAVAWATFLGYLMTALLGLVVVLGSVVAGVGLWSGPSSSPGRGLFYRYDVWSWGAETCAALIILAVTAGMVGLYLRERTGWEVGFGAIFLTLFVTGYAPFLAVTPLYGATGLVSLLIATYVLRRLARPSGGEPRTFLGQVPRRARRPVAIAIAVGLPIMCVYVLGYATTHPLRDDWDAQTRAVFKREPGALNHYPLRIRNAGRAGVTDVSLVRTEGSPALAVERARVEVFDEDTGRGEGELVLRQGQTCPPGLATLDAVWIRYTVLGMRHEQRIPLVHGPAVRCR
jgi:hypothetical protein